MHEAGSTLPPHTRVLVTGGAGFIGRHLVARLAGGGAAVTVTTGRPVTDVAPPIEGAAALRRVDLGDPAATAALVAEVRPQVVFHLAATVTGSRDREALMPTLRHNLTATVHLLDALAVAGGCERFVHAGSLEEPPLGDPAAPASPYAASKVAATAYVRLFHESYGLPTTVARIFMVYGPGVQNEDRVVPYVIGSLLRGEAPLLGSGSRVVDWVHVDDVVEGLVRLAVAPAAVGRSVDLGTGAGATIADMAMRVHDLVGAAVAPVFGARAERASDPERVADVAATRAMLGWAPATSLDDGLASTVAWLRAR